MKKNQRMVGVMVAIMITGSGCLNLDWGMDSDPRDPSDDPVLALENCERLERYLEKVRDWEYDYAIMDDAAGEPSAEDQTGAAADEGEDQGAASENRIPSAADIVAADGSVLFLTRSPDYESSSLFESYGIGESGEVALLDSIELSGSAPEFLLGDEVAVVFASGWDGEAEEYGVWVHQIDRSDAGQLTVRQSFFLAGASYVTSRLVDETVHLVAASWLDPWGYEELSAEEVLPVIRRTGPGEETSERQISCGETFLPDDLFEDDSILYGSLMTVISLPLEGEGWDPAVSTVMTQGWSRIVSASEESLYLASDGWNESEIFKFDLADDPGRAVFAAHGKVPGRLTTATGGGGFNDQYSMDEHEGFLRVAASSWSDDWTAESSLYVLQQEGRELKIVGSLQNLHDGESIYAVRFVGGRGYVVTFETIDPLFVIDLADPTQPAIVGSLEVPGFSTYLQPIDGQTLLAIGRTTEDEGEFNWWGSLQLSLFDVSGTPSLLDRVEIEGAYESEALTDRRALSWFPDRELIALPTWDEEQVWQVSRDEGFRLAGKIRHDDWVRRAVEIQGRLLTVSNVGLKAHDFEDLETELASVAFP